MFNNPVVPAMELPGFELRRGVGDGDSTPPEAGGVLLILWIEGGYGQLVSPRSKATLEFLPLTVTPPL
jgi:hypothetical protein